MNLDRTLAIAANYVDGASVGVSRELCGNPFYRAASRLWDRWAAHLMDPDFPTEMDLDVGDLPYREFALQHLRFAEAHPAYYNAQC